MHDEVAVIHQHPPGVVGALHAVRGGAACRLHALLDLLGDRADEPHVGRAGDDEGVGDPQEVPDVEDDSLLALLARRRPGRLCRPLPSLVQVSLLVC